MNFVDKRKVPGVPYLCHWQNPVVGFGSLRDSVDTSTTAFYGGFFVSAAWHLLGWLCGEHSARRFRVPGLPTRIAALFSFGSETGQEYSLFLLEDVSKACEKLPENEKLIRKLFVSGQSREMLCVTESGLYRLIFRSNKPEAEKFRRWVFHDVLPSIRKTGAYIQPENPADKNVNIRHFRNPVSPSGLDIRYTLDLTKIAVNPKRLSMEVLSRLTGNETYTTLSELYFAYLEWFGLEELPVEKRASRKRLSACLSELGYAKAKRGGYYRFYGIALCRYEGA